MAKKRYYSTKEVSHLLGYAPSQLAYELRYRGNYYGVKAVRKGRGLLWPAKQVDELRVKFLEARARLHELAKQKRGSKHETK